MLWNIFAKLDDNKQSIKKSCVFIESSDVASYAGNLNSG